MEHDGLCICLDFSVLELDLKLVADENDRNVLADPDQDPVPVGDFIHRPY